MKPVHFDQRVPHTKWCVLRWPSPSMAQLAQMSTEAFEEFYFNVCTLDYAKMDAAAKALKDRMMATDRVHLKGPGDTDLSFSIKEIPCVPCTGTHNIPDGECFTAPVRDSVNGVIHFNTPTVYNGVTFENIRLTFKNGQVVEASCDGEDDKLNSILDTDEGARYVGEFAIGFNPYILEAMKDILFDEKIAGSLHFTPGRAYDDADNGNRSEIHWDLVLIQRPEHGGGTIAFDDEIVRRDGLFITDDLAALNPDALKA
jgi:aminopeptidase